MILQVLGRWVWGPICVDLPGETQSFFIPIMTFCLIIKLWRVERSQMVEQNPICGKNHECSTAQENVKLKVYIKTNTRSHRSVAVHRTLHQFKFCICHSSQATQAHPLPPQYCLRKVQEIICLEGALCRERWDFVII